MTKFLIVEARFYDDIADALQEGATTALKKARVQYDVITVPGALEIPAAIAMAVNSLEYDGYVALGCVIRGETSHYDTVCNESARGLSNLAIEYAMPITNGIITVENEAQAWARAKMTEMDKGGFAARAAIQMLEVQKKFDDMGEEDE